MQEIQQRDPKIIKETIDLFKQVIMPLWHITRSQIHKLEVEGQEVITPFQFHTIRQIHNGTDSVSGLAGCLHVSRPNISRLVDELVLDGIVERNRNLDDRRNVKLTLTENGKKLIEDLQKRHSQVLIEQFTILDDEELKTLNSAFLSMKKIIDHAKQE